MTTPSFEELASGGGHKDATLHIGGHGEPWTDLKILVITIEGQTYVGTRRNGQEVVRLAVSRRDGMKIFATELQAAIGELPEGPAA